MPHRTGLGIKPLAFQLEKQTLKNIYIIQWGLLALKVPSSPFPTQGNFCHFSPQPPPTAPQRTNQKGHYLNKSCKSPRGQPEQRAPTSGPG